MEGKSTKNLVVRPCSGSWVELFPWCSYPPSLCYETLFSSNAVAFLHSHQLGSVWAPARSRCTQVSTQILSVFSPDMLCWSTWPVNCASGMGIFSLSTFCSLYFTRPPRGMEAIVGIKSAFFSAVLPVKNDLAFRYSLLWSLTKLLVLWERVPGWGLQRTLSCLSSFPSS